MSAEALPMDTSQSVVQSRVSEPPGQTEGQSEYLGLQQLTIAW